MNTKNLFKVVLCLMGLLSCFWQVPANSETSNPISISRAEASAYVNDGLYIISTSINSRYVLDVSGAGTARGTNVQIWRWDDVPQQEFYITHVGNGWYKIQDSHSGKVLDVEGAVSDSEVNVIIWDNKYSDDYNQLWCFIPAGNGYYYIQNALGYFLDVKAGVAQNGTNVWVYSENHSDAQMWYLSRI